MKNAIIASCLGVMALTLPGCAVVEDGPDQISIRHAAANVVGIQKKADEHCALTGRKAHKIITSPVDATKFVQTRVSTFVCR